MKVERKMEMGGLVFMGLYFYELKYEKTWVIIFLWFEIWKDLIALNIPGSDKIKIHKIWSRVWFSCPE